MTKAWEVECRALAIWCAAEMKFPSHLRRMCPDETDKDSGAWRRCLEQGYREMIEDDYAKATKKD